MSVGVRHVELNALYGFAERQLHVVKRYWLWEVVWLFYSLVSVLSIGFLASGLGSLGASNSAFDLHKAQLYLLIGALLWGYLSLVFMEAAYAIAFVTLSAPTSMPFQLRSVGRRKRASAARSVGSSGRKRATITAMTVSAARPAPSSHLMAIPSPCSGSAPQNMPSAPVFTKTRAPRSFMISVQKRPVPATCHGYCAHAAQRWRGGFGAPTPAISRSRDDSGDDWRMDRGRPGVPAWVARSPGRRG